MYLDRIETVFNRQERNDDGGERGEGLGTFTQNVRLFGPITRAPDVHEKEREMAHWFVLNNTFEVDEFIEYVSSYIWFQLSLRLLILSNSYILNREHKRLLESISQVNIEKRHRDGFSMWFKQRVSRNNIYFS
ncbi:hypothetical protein Dimus_038232 [Dionaea muscipula]